MKPIKYEGRIITPIMKPMLVWDDDESKAIERFVYVKNEPSNCPWLGGAGARELAWRWKNAKPIPEIEITVKINGKEAKLSDISEETLLNLRKI